MQTGIFDGISNSDYHGGPGVSKSTLDLVAMSPLHLRRVQVAAANDEPRKSTQSQDFGTAFHALLLEPSEFMRTYCLALRPQDVPGAIQDRDQLVAMIEELNADRLAKLPVTGTKEELVARIQAAAQEAGIAVPAPEVLEPLKLADLKAILVGYNAARPGKLSTSGSMTELAQLLRENGRNVVLWAEAREEWDRNNGHRVVLSSEDWERLHRMREAVHAHPVAAALLSMPGRAEHSAYWNDPETGELCRCRPDWLTDSGFVVDLKTCADASPEGFRASVRKWRYYVQDPFYLDGLREAGVHAHTFLFLAVQQDACLVDGQPFGVMLYQLDPEAREVGRQQYRKDLATYAECKRSGVWPSHGEGVQVLGLDAWFLKRHEDQALEA